MIFLKIVNEKTKEEMKSVHVDRSMVIGRGILADINLEKDKYLSRIHTLVIPRPDKKLEIRDLCSRTGTQVLQKGKSRRLFPEIISDGFKKGRAVLSIGESFFVGEYSIEVCYEEIIGEPTLDLVDDEDEITGVEEIDQYRED